MLPDTSLPTSHSSSPANNSCAHYDSTKYDSTKYDSTKYDSTKYDSTKVAVDRRSNARRYGSLTFSFHSFLACVLLAGAVGLAGCSKKGAGSIEGEDGDGSISESDLNAQREGRFGSGSIPAAEGEGLFRDIRFDYDSAAVDDRAHQDLTHNAEVLERESQLKITLEGHCDQRGTMEYNMALGSERARAVKSALAALGVSSSRIDTISYGEEVPLDPGQDEQAFSQNRRVHFSASSGGNVKPRASQY